MAIPDHPIRVWRAGREPARFANMGSQDDRDWVAFVPAGVELPDWANEGGPFGCCQVDQVETFNGIVLIGYHA